MSIVQLPQVGESVTEGIIGKWLKQEGDLVEEYEPLVEVVTDKVTMELPSPESGTLTKILAECPLDLLQASETFARHPMHFQK